MTLIVNTTTLSYNDYDARDYIVDNVISVPGVTPDSVLHSISETYYQNGWGSCTAMATTHTMKIQNEKEHGKIFLNWKDLRVKMGHHLDDKKDSGDSIENAVKTALKNGILGELNGKPHIFKALCWAYGKREDWRRVISKQPLITAIQGNTRTWNEMLNGEVKTILTSRKGTTGHAILINGFDDKWVYFINSFGDSIKKNGISQFKMSRKNFDLAIGGGMINWRYFVIIDSTDKLYIKEKEYSKQIIDSCKKLYEIGDKDIKEYFEKILITKKLTERYLNK